MIKTLKNSLKIDLTSSINTFIYLLKTGIFKFIFKNFPYQNKVIKNIAFVLSVLYSSLSKIVCRLMYYIIILEGLKIAGYYTTDNFIFVIIIFSFIGLFINNNLLNSSKKKYYSICLFGMDAKEYLISYLNINLFISFILNIGILSIMLGSFGMGFIISLICLFIKVIGESLNIRYFKKFGNYISSNIYLYLLIVISFFLVIGICLYFNIDLNTSYLYIVLGVSIIFGVMSYIYVLKVDDYKVVMKKINNEQRVFNSSNNNNNYSRSTMYEINSKDKVIDSNKIKNKHGYDLLNTCFFERHKGILLRSAIYYSIFIFVVFLVLVILGLFNSKIFEPVNFVINNKLAWFVLLMYFINRGSVITQAMFFNCDHALLTYNFYRDPKVIVNLFKKRLSTVAKVNLIPAGVLGICLIILLYLSGGTSVLINYLSIFVSILSLSLFFSVHYLVLYYLLQPYNSKMQMKSFSYSLVSFLTYYFCYLCKDIVLSSTYFAIGTIIVTIIYIGIALSLVYKKAPETFRLK